MLPNDPSHFGWNAPKTNMSEVVKVRQAIIDDHAAVFVTLFQIRPITNGPIKHPERVPQLIPIKYAMAVKPNFSFNIANVTEIMINTRQRIRITQFTFLSLAFLSIAPLYRSTATTDALASETDESVDILAERISTAITPVRPTGIAILSI